MNALRLVPLALLGAASLSFGQWNVNQLYANTVKAGTSWGSSLLTLDTLDVDVRVDGGLVRTRATMAWTPSRVASVQSRLVPVDCPTTGKDSVLVCFPSHSAYDTTWFDADSLEMRSYLQLPSDAAVSGMWLWVGEEKVASYVMDRWKAAQQYSQIVGARRDPALLETWGNGSYNLSLFPLKTGERRKLQIEVVQALRDGLVLPFASRGVRSRYDYNTQKYSYDTIRPGFVRLSVKGDGATATTLDLGTLGSIAVGRDSVTRTWTRPDSFVAVAKGRTNEVWTAVRDGKGAFGAATTFKGADLVFSPEPKVRLVVLDATDSVERIRKLALLSLLKYGQEPYAVNLLWRDEKGLQRLWDKPAALDAARALQALAFLKTWKPSVKPDAEATLREVVRADSGAVVVLVSTSPYETFKLTYPGYSSDTASATYKAYRAYYDSSSSFYKRLNDKWAAVGQILSGARQTLFGWWNDSYVGTAASKTGGYSFGSVNYPWYRWWVASDSIAAPALFGPKRYGYRENPQNLKVRIEGIETDSLAYMFRNSYGGWWWGGDVILVRNTAVMLDRSASFAARATASGEPYSMVYDDSLPLYFAARYARGGQAKLTLNGTWGGLTFTATRTYQVPAPSGTEWGTRVWAGEYANMAQPNIWSDTATQAAVRALGKAYQIVTPATSFLALEPGMKPLDSLAGKAEGTSDAVAGVPKNSLLVSDEATWSSSNSGSAFDSTSLDDLLAGRVVSVKKSATPAVVGLRIRSGAAVDLEVLGHDDAFAKVRILDLNGREVAKLAMVRSGDRWIASWKPTGRGVFFAVAEGPRWKHTSSFTAGR